MSQPLETGASMRIEKKLVRLRVIARKQGPYVMNKLFDDYERGPIDKKIISSCILCGSEENLTREHVLPKWVFDSSPKPTFRTDVNQLSKAFIKTTLPTCRRCNCDLLNSLERQVQRILTEVDLRTSGYSEEDQEHIIRWLETIDYKFQVLDISTQFLKHKKADYIASLAFFSIAFMRHLSLRTITTMARRSLKRIATKDKSTRLNALVVGTTKNTQFHYFQTSGEFIFLELPKYNKFFFYFFEREFRSNAAAGKLAIKIIRSAHEQ